MLSRQFDIVESLSVSLDKQFFVHAGPEITGNEMFESQRYTTKLVMYEGLRERCSDWINSLLLYMCGPFLEFQIGVLTVLIRLTLSSWTLAYSCLYGLAVTFHCTITVLWFPYFTQALRAAYTYAACCCANSVYFNGGSYTSRSTAHQRAAYVWTALEAVYILITLASSVWAK